MFDSKASRVDPSAITAKVETDVIAAQSKANPNRLVAAIDQGTSSSRFVLFTTQGKIAAWSQMEHKQIFPEGEDKVGWHEHDPLEIWYNVQTCMAAAVAALEKKSIHFTIQAVGITNQRETTVAWNQNTGSPYYNAIVWDDTRTTGIAHTLADGNPDRFRDKTGLPCDSYFAGTKVKWLLDHVPALSKDIQDRPQEVKFGTIDSWLLYQLSGKPSGLPKSANVGGLFSTDVSNASRWLFLDIELVEWDMALVDAICHPHHVPSSALPQICASSQVYAICSQESTSVPAMQGVPVASILGDQQAALFGQCAFQAGEAKNTYGTGMFLMMNTGRQRVASQHGLLTTIAFQLGNSTKDTVHYALEGSVSHSGSTIQWLRDQLQIIAKASESEDFATKHNDGLYVVPAFAGLFAPHWRSDARACIVGMTASHHKGHICRAALEAAAYQTKEVFDAIYADSQVLLKSLKVDGGGTNNELLMQFQADMINVPVVKPRVMETTSMGAAFGAGLAVGVWKDLDEIRQLWAQSEIFVPKMTDAERIKNWAGWQKAVTKSLGWVEEEDDDDEEFVDAREGYCEEIGGAISETSFGTFNLVVLTLFAIGGGFLLGQHHRR